jgi:3-methyladenine DNA glycosylase/8-oxoguanine DNA glycosylase
MIRRTLRTPFPLDLGSTLRPLLRGRGDLTMRLDRQEAWRATRTPEGPATTHFEALGREVEVTAWGPGAAFALDIVPELVGVRDRPEEFTPKHPVIRDLHRRMPGMRIGKSFAVVEALICSIIEQKVTNVEARRSYYALVRTYSEPAPGPAGLMLPPDPKVLGELPYYAFHPLGLERRRADTIRRVSIWAPKLEAAASMPLEEARRRLTMIPGVGAWTAAEVALVALGDPDAVSVGDYHLPHQVAWVLAGEPRADDARMLELLAPYRGQRSRAIRLISASGRQPPRRGPRMPLRSITRI